MAKEAISIFAARAKRAGHNQPLNQLIERAQVLNRSLRKSQNIIAGINEYGSLARFFESTISETLICSKMIGVDILLCGIYISRLLADIGSRSPQSWYAFDFILESNNSSDPAIVKNGADVCFLLCSVFPRKAGRRVMNVKDYEKIGAGLYYHFYSATEKIIGRHMSNNFSVMAAVTQQSLALALER